MTTNTKLASAALLGLLTAGMLAAQPALAGSDKASCKGANGCKGNSQAEKSQCNGADKSSCNAKDGEKASCKSSNGCHGKDGK
ncbi:MAG: hypothetical protein J0M34_05215 [Alphaproteobacteria bacterium]|nr:hypothetical protein [Alphaproteobacteria bacterium]